MKELISNYIDLRLLVVIVIALLSFIIFKYIFKKISMPKIVQIFLILLVLSANIFNLYRYISTIENEYIETKKEYYIKGEVKFISNSINKIRVEYIDTNLLIKDLDSNDVMVNIKSSTIICDRNGNRIRMNEIENGDLVYVKTNFSTLKDGNREITANLIQKY